MKIEIPNKCPACGHKIKRVNDQLFCINNLCDAVSHKRVVNYASKMKILGLGEKTIEALNIKTISEIYTLDEDFVYKTIGEKLGKKLFSNIEKSKIIDLSTFIYSLGIPSIGKGTANKIAENVDSIWEVDEEICQAAKIGTVATNSLLSWIDNNLELYAELPINTIPNKKIEKSIKVCITGKLDRFKSRQKAANYLKDYEIEVVSNISKNTDYLICDLDISNSSSYNKAKEYNIPIITMDNLLEKIELGEI